MNPNYCLIIYPVCVEGAEPIYLYIGQSTYDTQYEIFLDSYFITFNDTPTLPGTYYTGGLCPAVIGEECLECVSNPGGPFPFESISIGELTEGETCSGNNCVLLQNCENTSEQLVATSELFFYIGTVVKIAGSDKCWNVLANGPCSASASYTVVEVCDNCISCLPVVEPAIPEVLPQYFEEFTQTSETQNEIDTSIKFANAYWDIYKSLKHGIESLCTNIDIDRITVKKKACDLAKLYDANACIVPEPAPEPEVCVEPSGTPLPAPITVTYTYGTYGDNSIVPSITPSEGCCPENNCCTEFLDNLGDQVFTFNFVVNQEITEEDLPVFINHNACCILINNVVPPISPDVVFKIKTVDFTNPGETTIINNGDCGSCFA
jgi:hypothetical protein